MNEKYIISACDLADLITNKKLIIKNRFGYENEDVEIILSDS